ncbi:MAG: hypothetical protein ACI38Z_03305 [Parafannyhessea sp.]|uniref:hypothetical protein n=1 Tax=Parafannyhessea sp. TaxID=2847324 RepID=UPI003F0C28C8
MANDKSKQGKATTAKQGGANASSAQPTMSKAQREALIDEADKQTRAIMRLEVYKRLSYSVVAVGALLIYSYVFQHAAFWTYALGIVCIVFGAAAAIVLYIGVRNAKKNVRRILEAVGVDPDAVRTKKDVKAETGEKSKTAASDHAKGKGGKPKSK